MARKKAKYVHVRDIVSLYSSSNMIKRFCQGIGFSSIWREEDKVLEPCSKMERANMVTMGRPYSSHFYFHLLVIHKLRVIVPLKSFKVNFLATTNISPSQIMTNVWSIIRAFQLICCHFGVPRTIWVFLSFLAYRSSTTTVE